MQGPYGTQTYIEGANPDDRPTLVQTLSPDQQKILDQSNATKLQLGELGQQGATALQGIVGKPLDLSSAPAAPGDYSSLRDSVTNAMMSRVNTDTDNARAQKQSDLIAAGIRPGSKAYDDQMALIDRGYNDARQQAIINAGNATQQAFGMDTQARKDAIAELLAKRQTPLNEVSALMSGSQVSNPFANPGYATSNVAPAPVFNAAMQQGQYGTDVFNAKAAQANNFQSGLFGLGAAAILA